MHTHAESFYSLEANVLACKDKARVMLRHLYMHTILYVDRLFVISAPAT